MTLFPCLSQKSKVLSGLTLNKVVYFFSILLSCHQRPINLWFGFSVSLSVIVSILMF